MAVGQQPARQVGADETSSARYQYSHLADPFHPPVAVFLMSTYPSSAEHPRVLPHVAKHVHADVRRAEAESALFASIAPRRDPSLAVAARRTLSMLYGCYQLRTRGQARLEGEAFIIGSYQAKQGGARAW